MARAAKPETKRTIGSMTDQMRAFAHEYCVDFHGMNAAIRAGYSEKSATVQASKLLARLDVQEIIKKKMTAIERTTGINAERVLTETWNIATANVNELVEFRRACCRHCYGIDYGYQRTMQEMSSDRREYNTARTKAIAKDPALASTYEDFDEKGGIGYDARKDPVSDCTSCWGNGVGNAHYKDTRKLSPAALSLYAGVKQTKDGFQMLLVDKTAALEKLFKHFGLYAVDHGQKADAMAEFFAAVQARGSKLPIKDQ
jgi:phage terminase small subunit